MKTDLRPFLLIVLLVPILALEAIAQPSVVTEVPPFSDNFTPVGDFVYFTAGPGPAQPTALYRTDATAGGTIQLADNLSIRNFHTYKNNLYFFSLPSNGVVELWKSDGTPSGTLMLGSFEEVSIMGQTDQYLFFAASTPATGRELYRTDGTPGGTTMVMDISPGPENGIVDRVLATSVRNTWPPFPAATLGNQIYFPANDGAHGKELWKSDGTAAGTQIVADLNPGASDGVTSDRPETYEGFVYFTAITPTHGQEPWKTDGTEAGTMLLTETAPGTAGSRIDFFPEQYGPLFFAARPQDDDFDTYLLWKTEGTAESTAVVETLCQGCTVDSLFHYYENSLFFFLKYSLDHAFWKTNGTAGGTEMVWEIDQLDGEIHFLEEVNGYMLFYTIGQGHSLDILRSDGASVETVREIRSGLSTPPISWAIVNDILFFADHDTDHFNDPQDPDDVLQLMQSDGLVVEPLRDVYGVSFARSDNLTNYDGQLLFTTGVSQEPLTVWVYTPEHAPGSEHSLTVVDADTNEDLQPLQDGDVLSIAEGTSINIRYNPSGNPGSVVFKHQGKVVRRENQAPFALSGDYSGDYLVWEGATPGEHTIEAIAYSGPNGTGEAGAPLVVTFTITQTEACTATGQIAYEKWNGIQGTEVSLVPVNSAPSTVSTLNVFEAPSNQGTNYGARIRGYLCVPKTGNYTFWIASNDHSELWLSTDDNPASTRRIAWLTRATGPQEWDKFSTQESMPIWLEAGQRYYVEALHKQGVGTDHLAVGWQLPDGTLERPITGAHLSPVEMIAPIALVSGETFVAQPEVFNAISVYPNPAQAGTTELRVAGYQGIDQEIRTEVSITDFMGNVVFSDAISCGGDCGEYPLTIGRQLPQGLYLIKLRSGDNVRTQRLVVE